MLRYFSHDSIAAKPRSLPLKIILNAEDFAATWEAADSMLFTALGDSVFYLPGMESAIPWDILSN